MDDTTRDATSPLRPTKPLAASTIARPTIPGFELLDELGRGGMGVVFKARQVALNRLVAIKMILGGKQLPEEDRLRFLGEAEAIAAVRHPNVVQIYEYGDADGLPFFAMEFVEGGSMSQLLRKNGPMQPIAAAKLLASVARGIQAVHDVGVVHRDLKPANILLHVESHKAEGRNLEDTAVAGPDFTTLRFDGLATPKVTDFGIAKRATRKDLTETGIVMGTPAYMAPEQAAGNAKFVGTGADIYSLGVLLFECLSGRTPFEADDARSLMFRVVDEEAPSVRQFAPAVPRDLELICEKCLAKTPYQRYPSAAALADDLDRFVAGEPVSVYPPGRLEKAVRWIRKYPTRAAIYGLMALAVVLGGIATGAMNLYREAEAARKESVAALARATAANIETEAAREQTQQALDREKVALKREEAARRDELAEKAAHDIELAHREYEANNVAEARRLLAACPKEFRTWEWRYLDKLCFRERHVFQAEGVPEIGLAGMFGVGFTPDTATLMTVSWAAFQRWDIASGRSVKVGDGGTVGAFSGDGTRVAIVGARDTIVYDCVTQKPFRTLKNNGGASAMLNHDGSRLLLTSRDQASIWDVAKGTSAALAMEDFDATHPTLSTCGAMTRDGQRIAVGGLGKAPKHPPGILKIWPEGETGKSFVIPIHPQMPVTVLAFEPAGFRLAAGCVDGTVAVLDLASNRIARRFRAHESTITCMAYDPTGKLFATASLDRTVRLWDNVTGSELLTFKGHSKHVRGLAFSADGKRLASAGFDGTARVWDITMQPDVIRLAGLQPSELTRGVAISNDASHVVVAHGFAPIQAFRSMTGAALWPAPNQGTTITSVEISTDGKRIITLSDIGTLREVELTSGHLLAERKQFTVPAKVRASADRTRGIELSGVKGAMRLFDLKTGAEGKTIGPHVTGNQWPTISANGKRVLTPGRFDSTARVWDTDTGQQVFGLEGHIGVIHAAAFSPDGSRIATAGEEGWLKLWDGRTGRGALTFRGNGHKLWAVGWSEDGSKLMAIDDNGAAYIRDAGQPK